VSSTGYNGSTFDQSDYPPEQWEGKDFTGHQARFRPHGREPAYIIMFQWLATMGADVSVAIVAQFLTTLRTFGISYEGFGLSAPKITRSGTSGGNSGAR
jgi:hypothetical protein